MEQGISSFSKFTLGFLVLISLSFGLTYAVNTITINQEREEQTAAALQAMIGGEE